MTASKLPKGPLTREEYERRHKELQAKYDKVAAKYDKVAAKYATFSHRVYRALALFVVALLLTGGAFAFLFNENSERTGEIEQTQREINNSLISGCKENGNPLRKTVRKFGSTLIEQTQRQINQSNTFEKSGTYQEIFPDYPPDKLHALLVKNRADDRKTKRELRKAKKSAKPVNCEARYSPK